MVNFKLTAFICHVWFNRFSTCTCRVKPSNCSYIKWYCNDSFSIFTKWQVPAYLGSSFAFIAPIIAAKAAEGPGGAMIGCFMIGIVYIIVALIIKQSGYRWIMKLLPPVVVGPVIMVIGLALAPTAIGMAMNNPVGEYDLLYFSAGLVTLLSTIIFSVFSKGFLGNINLSGNYCRLYLFSPNWNCRFYSSITSKVV